MLKWTALAASAVVVGLLAGCASDDAIQPGYNPENDSIDGRPDRAGRHRIDGSLFGGDILGGTFSGSENAGAQLPVNKYLWRSSLDTLSFLPLASTDPYGGVIITEWGAAPEAPNERFKVTAYITSAEFKPQSLRVVVNRQKQSGAGWVTAGVSQETANKLEEAILTRARQLRAKDTGKTK